MKDTIMTKKILITGSAGFIGFHLSKRLLDQGYEVIGIDALTDYYDVRLKKKRLDILKNYTGFIEVFGKIEDDHVCQNLLDNFEFDCIVHLAAQAGVRYSIENPKIYLETNIIGTFNILELAKKKEVSHLLCASTSSVYGSNSIMPFTESQKCDTQMSFYAATKKSNEIMAHSYSHIHNIPTTMFRFFTVYGPWGRPDMALFKFTKAILENKCINVYNHGNMTRDFTYIDDLVQAINKLILVPPQAPNKRKELLINDSLSDVAPWRVVNIGNSEPIKLMVYIQALENALGKKAAKKFFGMQPGDVSATWADTNLLYSLTGFKPQTSIDEGVQYFVEWYLNYYKSKL